MKLTTVAHFERVGGVQRARAAGNGRPYFEVKSDESVQLSLRSWFLVKIRYRPIEATRFKIMMLRLIFIKLND